MTDLENHPELFSYTVTRITDAITEISVRHVNGNETKRKLMCSREHPGFCANVRYELRQALAYLVAEASQERSQRHLSLIP